MPAGVNYEYRVVAYDINDGDKAYYNPYNHYININECATVCPASIIATTLPTDESCPGNADGSIRVILNPVTTGPYNYEIDYAGASIVGSSSQDETINNLPSGNYEIIVSDGTGCMDTTSITISSPAAIVFDTIQVTDITSAGGSDGAIDIEISGGTAPYNFTWGHGPSTEDVSGLTAGFYTITVTDNNSCSRDTIITVSEPGIMNITGAITDVSCFGGNDGTITLSVTGGIAPYTYLWNTSSTADSIENVPAGDYSVTVTDQNLVSESRLFTIGETSPVMASAGADQSVCQDENVFLNASGGIHYQWNTSDTTQTVLLTGLTASTHHYYVTVSDASGCTGTDSIFVTVHAPPVPNLGTEAKICQGSAPTPAYINAGAGYTDYRWSTGDSIQIIGVTDTGYVSVTVTDSYGCTGSDTIPVRSYPLPFAILGPADTVSICQFDTAWLDASSSINADSYLWSPGNETDSVIHAVPLTSGIHEFGVTVTSPDGCTSNDRIWVKVNPAPSPVIIGEQYPFVETDSVEYSLPGSITGHHIRWETGSAGTIVNDQGNAVLVNWGDDTTIPAWVTVYDTLAATGCHYSYTLNIHLTAPAPIQLVASPIDITCNGGSNGKITLSQIKGGVKPYNLYLDDVLLVADTNLSSYLITSLGTGIYKVKLLDSRGVSDSVTIPIGEPIPLQNIFSTADALCFNEPSGTITANTTGGTAPYTYHFDGKTVPTQILTGLTAKTYIITIEDHNGCTLVDTATVGQPPAILVETNVTPAYCPLQPDGNITITASGGSGSGYNFAWSNGMSGASINAISGGTYYVTTTDGTCSITTTVQVGYIKEHCFKVPTAFSPNGDGINDEWRMDGLSFFYKNCNVTVFSRWGEIVYSSKGYKYPWDGNHNGEPLPVDSYHFVIELGDGSNPIVGQVTILK
jgi:gliding motility-associated-like protein